MSANLRSMKLIVVRHGQTTENAQNIIQGQLPGTLSQKGIEQVKATAEKLKSVQLDAIYCSDLARCVDTAAIIARYHPNQKIVYTKLLRERKGGNLEGQVLNTAYWESLPGTEQSRRYPGGGESWEDVKTRVKPFLNKLFVDHQKDTVLLVTHGGVIRSIRAYMENIPLSELDNDGNPNAGIWNFDMADAINWKLFDKPVDR